MSEVRVSVTESGVGWIVLNRPDHLNAITVALGRDLESALLDLGSDERVRVIGVRGAGGNFCAGGDFDEVGRLRQAGEAALRELFDRFRAACAAVDIVPVPVVAVVEGVAAAGGFEFMQAADIVLIRDDARVADNHIRFGQLPGGGSTARLPRLVGRQQALGLLLSGDRLTGLDAVRLGLAYRSWPAETFEDKVAEFLDALAGRRPDAVVGIKRLVRLADSSDLESALVREQHDVVAHMSGVAGGVGLTAFDERKRRD